MRELLPPQPVETVNLEPSWIGHAGYITEEDVKVGFNVSQRVKL